MTPMLAPASIARTAHRASRDFATSIAVATALMVAATSHCRAEPPAPSEPTVPSHITATSAETPDSQAPTMLSHGPVDAAAMAAFLDRLMQAESGGRDDARNPRSTAVGPFQFIERTFLEVCRRHFSEETRLLTPLQILALRSNRVFARRAAEAFTRDNAAVLAGNGVATTGENLRLAFLLGAEGAVRVLRSDPALPVISVVGALVVQANPFMAGMTVRDLSGWAVRNLAAGEPGRVIRTGVGARDVPLALAAPAARPKPAIAPPCRLELASCRKWLVLAERRAARVVQATAPRRARLR